MYLRRRSGEPSLKTECSGRGAFMWGVWPPSKQQVCRLTVTRLDLNCPDECSVCTPVRCPRCLCALHDVSPRDRWLCVLPGWQVNVNVNSVNGVEFFGL